MLANIETAVVVLLLGAFTFTAPPAAATTAEQNFEWYCVQCHGADGGGDGINSQVEELPVGPMALNKAKEMKKFSDDQIRKTLTHGGPVNNLESLMPTWGLRLSEQEIKELVPYVRSLCKEADCPR